MSLYVVDASVGVKWLVAEIHSDAARRLQDPAHDLHVPGFFDVEIGNIIWKKVRRGEISRQEGDVALALLDVLPVNRHADLPMIAPAFDIAVTAQRSVYDSLYVALAVQLGGRMVTADERLVNSLAATPWAAAVIRVQDVP